MRSVLFFALGVAIALLGLIVLSLLVAGCTPGNGETPAAATAVPTNTPAQPQHNEPPAGASLTALPAGTEPPAPTPEPTDAPAEAATPEYLIVSLLRKDAIPAILDPDFVPLAEANEQMKDEELVLGVSLDGDSRAYSVNLLSRHEIVNDVVGGRPIAVTW